MWRILALCAVICLHLVSATSHFTHPKDIRSNGGASPRVIGGEEVVPHSYPSQVALRVHAGTNSYFCGGSLISNQWLLTAAHCIDMTPDYIEVIMGDHDLNEIDPPVVIMNSTTYFIHSEYNNAAFMNDIGMVMLPEEVAFTENIKAAAFADGSDSYDDVDGTIVGWGVTDEGSTSDVLMKVDVNVLSNDECKGADSAYEQVIQPTHVCTSGEGRVGSCSGDSGGPLFVDGVQVGIGSFVYKDCLQSMPSVFTRVSEFHDWIENLMSDDSTGFDS